MFLEGTGSIILDPVNKIAYACVSPRTDEELFYEFCEDFEYEPVFLKRITPLTMKENKSITPTL